MRIKHLGALAVVLATIGCGATQDLPAPLTLSVLATGANIAGTNGIIFSPDNQLYAASVIGSNITIMDPDSGEILRQLGASDWRLRS